MTDNDLANEIRLIETKALEAGITIAHLCQEAEVDNSTFTRWKAGITEPRWRTIKKIETTLDRLLSGAAKPKPPREART